MRIHIDGSKKGQRYLIKVNDCDIWLQPALFTMFFQLAAARLGMLGTNGYLSALELRPEEAMNAHRYIYRLRRDILKTEDGAPRKQLDGWEVYELSKGTGYKLAAEPGEITFGSGIAEVEDYRVSGMAGELV